MIAVLVLASAGCQSGTPATCEQFYRAKMYREATVACDPARVRDPDGRLAAMQAQSFLFLDNREGAGRAADSLLRGLRAGVGHRIRGQLAFERGDHDEADEEFAAAVTMATNDAERMAAASARAKLQWTLGAWQGALASADLAIASARDAKQPYRRYEQQRIEVLRKLGDFPAAEEAAHEALAAATTPCDRAWLLFFLGKITSDRRQPALAAAAFADARRSSSGCDDGPAPDTIDLNEASTSFDAGQIDAAEEALDRLDETVETLLIRARIADRRGDRAGVDAALTRARAGRMPSADWPWEVSLLTAQAAENDGDAERAERAYRQAIAEVSELRARSLGSDGLTVARYRTVYDGLIALLARQERWRDAFAVVLALDASDMLRNTQVAPQLPDEHGDAVGGDTPVTGVVPSVEDVLDAWRGRELVIVVATSQRELGPGGERVFRLRVREGLVEGMEAGDAASAQRWAEKLYADPADQVAARGLGAIVAGTSATTTLDVLLVGSLGKTPLAALRDSGGLLIARRPLARVLSLRPRAPAIEHEPSSGAIVFADPQGDLPAAAAEGAQVAARLGATLFADAAATSDRLWTAAHADVLHLAAHVDEGSRQRRLRLADRVVTPAEIVERRLAPRLAVLASCGAAAARDEEGWGSLAQALLVAGSEHVIAADRSVDDVEAAALVAAFYGHASWRTEPARALSAAQASLATSHPVGGWAAFSVLAAPPRARR